MEPVALVAIVSVVAVSVLASATIHIVPAGTHAVVMRAGTPVRSRAAGFVHTLPGLERLELVPTQPPPLDPLAVHAITRDGVELQLVTSVLYRVVDPVRAAEAATDVRAATSDVIARALHHLVAQADLIGLLRDREAALQGLVTEPPADLEPLGVRLIDVDLLGTEVRVGAQLLNLLEAKPVPPPGENFSGKGCRGSCLVVVP